MADTKQKKYIADYADLMTEWDWDKNNQFGFNPNRLTFGSNKKVWWICSNKHSWDERIANRVRNRGCPYCSGHRVMSGYNDLSTTHPNIAADWDYDQNTDISPEQVSSGSSHNAWWKCSQGHSYQAKIANRTLLNRGCPYCAGRYPIIGVNDLETVNPILATQWHPTKNGSLRPNQVLPNSNKKVWWKGTCGHEWPAVIGSRQHGNGCPYCSHQAFDPANSLAVLNPELIPEWHPYKNDTLTPYDVHPNSSLSVWWVCEKGHEWQATIINRNHRRNCPICSREYKTSFPEQALYYYILQVFPDALNRYHEEGYELDIYIPSHKIGVEYDGLLYHTSQTIAKEIEKDSFFTSRGIHLIRVKECKTDNIDSEGIIWHIPRSDYPQLNSAIVRAIARICEITKQQPSNTDVDIIRDAPLIMSQYYSIAKDNGLAAKHPTLLHEWDYEKNGLLKPEFVPYASSKKVWWICSKGHNYQMAPIKRTTRQQGCPYCSGRYPTKENNLLAQNPALCIDWSYELNGDQLPNSFTPQSGKKVWWKCHECGHEWEASISNRSKGSGCPNCSKLKRNTQKSNRLGCIFL